MSGTKVSEDTHEYAGKTYRVTKFEMKIPVQSYLIAIVAGNVVEQKVGARSYVIGEPTNMAAYVAELNQLEQYLTTIEAYIGAYKWGQYKIVIQPPSFPYGGMENPLLTFASPTIIVGDKSGVSVAVHEIAHSWTGNTVTCADWSSFWLNEGFTVFLERTADKTLFGADFVKIDSTNGDSSMKADMNAFGLGSTYSSLYPDTKTENPDESFSVTPHHPIPT